MRAAYFDCFAGVSGDMIVGALIDLGVDPREIEQRVASLRLANYQLKVARVARSNIAATKFDVEIDPAQPERRLADIRSLIHSSALSELVKARAIKAFERLAEAEARVHGTTADRVHFHEAGAVDSIVDVVGTMIGFELLGVEKFYSSPLRLGHGTVKAEHGLLPIPAPGTAELLRGVPVYAGDLAGEFTTPTGAAIVTTLCESFGPMPAMTIEQVGYGAGTRDPEGFPNALRLVVGELGATATTEPAPTRVIVIETNIDDMNPQVYGFVMERAFKAGALDVFLTPIQMKKGRPGVELTLLCEPDRLDALVDLLLSETTTLGVRYWETSRRVLERVVETVETAYGLVRMKVARGGGRTLHFQPEYEDCARLAEGAGVTLLEVHTAATAAYALHLKAKEEGGDPNGKLEKE